MPANHLVTGPPRSGKTTTLELLLDEFRESVEHGGVVCPERRQDGDRVGFSIEALDTGATASLAAVDRTTGPQVGKYRVNVDAIDALGADAVDRAIDTDLVVVDEIGPMQCHGEAFLDAVRRALDADTPVVATIATHGLGDVAALRDRADGAVYDLRETTAESVADTIAAQLS